MADFSLVGKSELDIILPVLWPLKDSVAGISVTSEQAVGYDWSDPHQRCYPLVAARGNPEDWIPKSNHIGSSGPAIY